MLRDVENLYHIVLIAVEKLHHDVVLRAVRNLSCSTESPGKSITSSEGCENLYHVMPRAVKKSKSCSTESCRLSTSCSTKSREKSILKIVPTVIENIY